MFEVTHMTSGGVVDGFVDMGDAMALLKSLGHGYCVRRVIDGAILAVSESARLVRGSNLRDKAQLHNNISPRVRRLTPAGGWSS